MDADEAYRENVRRELDKNSTIYTEQILNATSHKTQFFLAAVVSI